MQPSPHKSSTLKTAGKIVPPPDEAATLPPAPAAPPAEAATLPPEAAPGVTGPLVPPSATPTAPTQAGFAVPGYEILGVLGKGGMGVVYKARQQGLKRVVALKMILHAEHAGPQERQRFKAEAEAVARLQHPHIVQVFEVGEHNGLPFFSLEFCGGGSLADKLDGTPLTPSEAARLVETLAGAMQVAHQAGIVHRDLKPANVLLADDGTPKVTDFGLAKRLDVAGQTQTGAVMGTPSYMAPEQAGGKSKDMGPAADVYALGAILYELLSGRPPFRAATALDTVLQVVSEEPVPVRQLQPKTPRDLETICLKCLRKEPKRRYATAEALAEDLGRYLRGEPVRARPVGRLGRGWRWCKRNRTVAGLLAAVAVLLVGGATASTWFGLQAQARAREARENAAREREARSVADDRLYASQLSLAQSYWKEGNVAAARDKLNEASEHRDSWEHRYLTTLMNHRGQRTFRGHTDSAFSACFSPDGQRLASGSADKTVKVWDAVTGQDLLTLTGHTHNVRSVCFSPDTKRLASASDDKTVKVWDAVTGQDLLTLTGHTWAVTSVCFSPDGNHLASGSGDNTVKVWDAATGKNLLTLKTHPLTVSSVCFSPDGRRLASGSYQTVRVWDAATGQELITLKAHTDRVTSVCFSPDGKHLASASFDNTVKVWDAATGKNLLTLKGHANTVFSVCFSPDGNRLASGSDDRTVKVWDAATGQDLLTLKGHTWAVTSVCFSPDGKQIASASMDKTVKMWDMATGQEPLTLMGHTGWVSSVCFSPDSKQIASAGGNEVRVCDAHTGEAILTLKGHTGLVRSVCFNPDGKQIASGSLDQTVKVWDAATGQEILTLKGHTGFVSSVCFSPDGQRLASGGMGYDPKTRKSWGELRVWDAATGQQILTLMGHTGQVTSVCFSPDGKRLASGSQDQTVRVWDTHSGQEILALKGHTSLVNSVCFSPDGKRLASDGADQTVRVWDAASGREVLTLKGQGGGVSCVCFSPDGKRLASGGNQTVKVWDAGATHDILTLKGHTNNVQSVCFSPDGQRLASGSLDRTAKVWDTHTGQEILTLRGHNGPVYVVNFSGMRLYSWGKNGEQIAWDVTTGQMLPGDYKPLVSPSPRSPDGRFFAAVEGMLIRIHRLPTGSQQDREEGRRWVEPDYHWHADQAQQSWQAGHWFAAAFHLNRLLPSRPWDADLHLRRAYALARRDKPPRPPGTTCRPFCSTPASPCPRSRLNHCACRASPTTADARTRRLPLRPA